MCFFVPVFHLNKKIHLKIWFSPFPSLTKSSLNRSVHLDSSDFFQTCISHLQSVCICPLMPSIPLASVRAVFSRNDLKLSCGDLVCPRDVVCEIASIVMDDIFPNTLISGTDGRAYLLHDIGWSGLSERAWFCQPSTFLKIFTFSFSSSPRMSHNLGKLGGFYRDPDLKSARSLILNINRTPTPTPPQ